MAQDETLKQFSNFSKGLMTEATPLNFPENYALDEANMLLAVNGSRERRKGIEFETGYATTLCTQTDAAVNMKFFKWDFADSNAANIIGVVQVGVQLWLYDLSEDAPSANLLNTGQAVSLVSASSTSNPAISFAVMNGILIMTSASFDAPYALEYDTATDFCTLSPIYVKVRDLWGVDDGQEIEDEATLTDTHDYNLENQGWTSANISTWGNPAPSSAHIMHLGKDATGAWTEATCRESFFGNSPAPKGKFILRFFERGTDRILSHSGTPVLVDDNEGGMFTAVATNFGRVFWAGVESDITDGDDRSPNASSLILFSQIIEKDYTQFGHCYTEADPTSEVIFNQVDSDGGIIKIPELGKVIKMEPLGNQMVIFATNGVWSVVSVDGLFTPTSYQVNKVTSIGVAGADSIVEVEGSIVYWSESGIYQLALDDVTGLAEVKDVTLQTIKTFYNNITKDAKQNAKAYYDSVTKQIGWLYQSDSAWDFTSYPDFCDKELIYDLQLQAFTVNTISTKTEQSPYIVGGILGNNAVTNSVINDVEVNADQIQVNGDDVEVTVDSTVTTTSKLKFLTYVPSGTGFATVTLSNYANDDYLDWDTEDYVSFLETGYIGFEDFARFKTVPYLICHFERTEDGFDDEYNATSPSSCLVQARWEWTDSSVSNRWGTEFQAYRYRRNYVPVDSDDRFETGHKIITTRNKLRGKGKSLSLYFKSETGKNMKLLGFVLSAVGGTEL